MSKEALKRIRANKKSKDEALDLSACELKELPKALEELVWLTSLSCDNNQISDLSPIAQLRNLTTLYCYDNQINDLSPIAQLSNLVSLYCWENQISDLAPIAQLSNLTTLNCSNNQISDLTPIANLSKLAKLYCHTNQISDLTPIANLSNLTGIYCGGNQISDLNPISKLSNLTELYCYSNQISDLTPIANLRNLTELYCSNNQISDLTPIANLSNLTTLSCSSNQISVLNSIKQLSNLTTLSCSSNQISDLKPIAKLSNLTMLFFENNQISDLKPILELIHMKIPVIWKSFNELAQETLTTRNIAILVKNCPLICPPLEIAQHSPEAVRDYFEELGEDGRKLNEVKVIFLGEASAGKTSLVKRLMGEDFDSKESQTHGIRIRKVPFDMNDGDSVTAHLWDFGGQEVMHATHQFFLSQRSVYVLLLNSRNDDLAEKWLKHAASFGGNSPVLVVLNKIDENPSFEVERKTLQEKYPQIKAFFRVSCKTESDRGFLDFKEALREAIDGATTRLTPFPKNWLAVKEHFSNMQADYIGAAEYQKVCVEKGVNRQVSQDVLLQFLHDLGVVINFRNLQYFDTQILNPLWLTNGVYRIINSSKVVENEGILREADFDAVINDPRYQKSDTTERQFSYPKDKLHYIVRVMEEFELCFMLENRSYVIPQLLPVAAPDWQAEGVRLQKLQLWDDRDIDAGEEWRKEIFQQMAESDIVICLVSADFVASDFCYQTEFGAALQAHQKGEKAIIPVMWRKTDWQDLPLSEIQGVPGEWINSLAKNKRDDAWTKVSERLRPALAKAKQRKQEQLEKMRNKIG